MKCLGQLSLEEEKGAGPEPGLQSQRQGHHAGEVHSTSVLWLL
jgi:hypothetical protein